MGVLATTFTALSFNLTMLRDEGVLKRIRGTPMPAGAYLAGFIGSATLNAVLQVVMVVRSATWSTASTGLRTRCS